jgi:hypothetical protein
MFMRVDSRCAPRGAPHHCAAYSRAQRSGISGLRVLLSGDLLCH